MRVCPRCSELYPDDVTECPRDQTPVRKVLDPLIGRTVGGRFRLIQRLGQGGMSSVYLARHVLIDRLMAIKTLRRNLARDPIQRDRFLREARAVNRINHDNIVEISDFGETEDGLVYLVMEYVPGEPLLKLMGDGPFEPLRALDIAEQCANALGRAHQMGVIHRDLKPENILIVQRRDRPDFVKLLDFGIAKILDAPSLTGSQQIFGTPGYIAPEYIQSTDIDGRSDLYSLGCILYEMVTGALPFDYEYPGDLLVKHVTEAPVPPSERYPAVDPPVEAFILRCLAKEPSERFRDAFHFNAELEAVRERLGPATSWGGLDESRRDDRVAADTESEQRRSTAVEGVMRGLAQVVASSGSEPQAATGEPRQGRARAARDTMIDGRRPDLGATEDTASPVRSGAASGASAAEAQPGVAASVVRPLAAEEAGEGGEAELAEGGAEGTSKAAEAEPPRIPEPPALGGAIEPQVLEASAPSLDRGTPTPPPLNRDGLLGAKRWRRRFEAIRTYLDELAAEEPTPMEIEQSMASAARSLDELEEAVTSAEAYQEAVESLHDRARDFRSTLGRAIDRVAGRLSAERGVFEALVTRRNSLRSQRESTRVKLRRGAATEGEADALLWELAAVEEELRGVGQQCDDLESQLAELSAELEANNERFEAERAQLVLVLDTQMVRLETTANGLRQPLERAEAYVRQRWPGSPPAGAVAETPSGGAARGR